MAVSCNLKLFVVVFLFLQDTFLKGAQTSEWDVEKKRFYFVHRMASYMDKTVNPCNDFYQFACGNYNRLKADTSYSDQMKHFISPEESLNKKIHEMLEEPVNSYDLEIRPFAKAKYFYQSCMREDIYSSTQSETYLKLVNSIGGWPALDPDWNEENFDFFNISLLFNMYGIGSLISESTDYNRTKLYFDPFIMSPAAPRKFEQSGLTYELHRNLYLIQAIMSQYGVSRRSTKEVLNDIRVFSETLQRYIENNSDKTQNEGVTVKFNNLSDILSNFNWTRFFKETYPESNLSSMEVVVHDINLYGNLYGLFTGKNIKRAANFLIAKLLLKLHDELYELRDLRTYCENQVEEVLKPVVTAMFLDSRYHDKDVETEIQAMIVDIVAAARNSIDSANWLNAKYKNQIRSHLERLEFVIADSKITLDLDDFMEYYSQLDIKPEYSFHENKLNVLRFLKLSSRKVNPFRYVYDPKKYSIEADEINLPVGLAQEPLYYKELPKAYNFGVIGSIIGHLLHCALIHDRNETQWKDDTFKNEFNSNARCFYDQYSSYELLNMFLNEEIISDNAGVRYAYLGYQNWLSANKESLDMSKFKLSTINMTHDQLFFLSFAQRECEEKEEVQHYNSFGMSGKWRVIGSLSNFEEFSKVFNCESGTPMNPEKKCLIW